MREKSLPPDHLRCNRTDGRQWRCKRRAMEGKALCEIHHLQGKHRHNKTKVPEYLKLERHVAIKKKTIGLKKTKKIEVNKRAECKIVRASEALDEALKRMGLQRGDLHLDLIRVFLKRQAEKKKERHMKKVEDVSVDDDEEREDEIKILPYGVMAISQSKVHNYGQNGGLDVKLGVESNGDICLMRSYRSKNIEPLPVGTMQVVPFADMIIKKKMKKCHWCRGSEHRSLVKCLTCRKRFYCVGCIKDRCFMKQEVQLKCPACHRRCGCKLCLKQQQGLNRQKERGERMVERIKKLRYLVYLLLPVLKMINSVKSKFEIEAKVTGNEPYEIQVSQVKTISFTALSCYRCKTSIVDCHKTCTKCLYNLCLSCCTELSQHNTSEELTLKNCKRRKIHSTPDEITFKKSRPKENYCTTPFQSIISSQILENGENGTVLCPPTAMGGCGDGFLDLKCIFPLTWTRDLEVRAEETLSSYCFPEITDSSSSCSLCDKIDAKDIEVRLQRQPCKRAIGSSLYCPIIKVLDENLEHFQNHWVKGHPVVVRDVLQSTKNLSWDPFTMFCSYIEAKSSESCDEDSLIPTACLDWCEVHIDRKRILMGSLEKKTHASMQRKVLKFKAWLSSQLFQKQFPIHYSKILSCLPLPDYVNPVSGLLNVCNKFPEEFQKPDLGPCICFSYGGPEDLMQADYLSNLSYELHDTVNILTYATDAPVSMEQINKIEDLMKRHKSQGHFRGQSSNSSNVEKCKSSLQSDDTVQSGLEEKTGEKSHLANGEKEVPFDLSEPLKAQTLGAENGNLHDGSESDFEESILCCGSVEISEDSDDYFHAEDTASSVSVEDNQRADSCGALWDVFPRQDVPKLLEYIRRHSSELRSACQYSKLVHPILDQNFFLDAYHILKLKKEFDIQPWTFEQCPGEAIFVPAGCPYQIRKVKSCVNVVLDFISPENAAHCIQLNEEIRLLPSWHKSKKKVLEVEKMALHGISEAIQDIIKLTPVEQVLLCLFLFD